jgi:hypothetical protein
MALFCGGMLAKNTGKLMPRNHFREVGSPRVPATAARHSLREGAERATSNSTTATISRTTATATSMARALGRGTIGGCSKSN